MASSRLNRAKPKFDTIQQHAENMSLVRTCIYSKDKSNFLQENIHLSGSVSCSYYLEQFYILCGFHQLLLFIFFSFQLCIQG